jgi:hypothetical protein
MPKTGKRRDLLEAKLTELTALIKDLSPKSRVEISFEQYEDEDAHVRVYLPPTIEPDKAEHIELTLGARCNDILVDTGLFIIGAVCD